MNLGHLHEVTSSFAGRTNGPRASGFTIRLGVAKPLTR
jgi:hypothetical protein